MKKINSPIVGLALFAVVSIGLISPAAATVGFASQATTKPTPVTASACYKAKLARTALNSVLRDADTVISIANKISSAMPAITSSVSKPTTWGELHNSLYANSATYSRLNTYVRALSSAATVLNDSASKVLKNVVVVKVPTSNKLDAIASFNGFSSIFANFPTDSAGIAITTRNIAESTNTLIDASDKAFGQSFPASAVSFYTRASSIEANYLGSDDFSQIALSVDSNIRDDVINYANIAGTSLGERIYRLGFDDATNGLLSLQADAIFFLAESQSLTTLAQQAKISANAALLKLPKC